MNSIEEKCQQKGVRLTDQRKTIAKVLSESKEVYGSKDHPDVDELHKRVTAIDDILLKEFMVYPNPTIDILYIRTPQILGKDYTISVYDFIGKKVFEFDNTKIQLEQPVINLATLAASNYKLIIKYKDGNIWNTTINKK